LRDVDVADPDESVLEVARRMRERNVGTLVLVDQAQRPVGLVTDRDLVLRALAENRDPQATLIRDVSTLDPRVISEDTAIESALALMRAGRFRRIPVVDREGCLVGVLSVDDVLTLLAEEMTTIGRLLEREAPHVEPG
jgi:CBS domain-containing protein